MTAPSGDWDGVAATDDSAVADPRYVAGVADLSFVGEQTVPGGVIVEDEAGHLDLVGSKCPKCGDVRYPPRAVCPIDLSPAQRVALPGRGVVYESVRVLLAPNGFEAPYWVGYVDLDGGARVFARISDELGQPMHGDRVVLTFALVRGRADAKLAPLFRPESTGD